MDDRQKFTFNSFAKASPQNLKESVNGLQNSLNQTFN